MKPLIIFIITLIIPATINAQTHTEVNQREPITIEADELIINRGQSQGTFIGNVVVVQGEMTITSDKMIVYYLEDSKEQTTKMHMDKEELNDHSLIDQNKISKIEAIGNVVMVTPKEKAIGDSGEYFTQQKVMILLGNVKLIQGGNILTGNKFVYNRVTGKGILSTKQNHTKCKKRAKALINPEKTK